MILLRQWNFITVGLVMMMISIASRKFTIGVFFIIFSISVDGWEDSDDIHYTNSWAVHIEDGDAEVASRIAKRHGFINLGQVR